MILHKRTGLTLAFINARMETLSTPQKVDVRVGSDDTRTRAE
jgi:hypothetical protein